MNAITATPLAFISNLAGPDTVVILLIVLLLFGGKKMPELARGLGQSIREFKKAAADTGDEPASTAATRESRPPVTHSAPAAAAGDPAPAPAMPSAAGPHRSAG